MMKVDRFKSVRTNSIRFNFSTNPMCDLAKSHDTILAKCLKEKYEKKKTNKNAILEFKTFHVLKVTIFHLANV